MSKPASTIIGRSSAPVLSLRFGEMLFQNQSNSFLSLYLDMTMVLPSLVLG
jgi:hypothetical protein